MRMNDRKRDKISLANRKWILSKKLHKQNIEHHRASPFAITTTKIHE
jgi:hypothetical protein